MKNKIPRTKIGLWMRMEKFSFFLASICFLLALKLHAIEIPLDGLDGKTKVATVNMHKIFETFSETEKARIELYKAIEEKRNLITEKKEEVTKLKGEIESLKKQIFMQTSTVSVQSSTPPLIKSDETLKKSTDSLTANFKTLSLSTPVVQISTTAKISELFIQEKEALLIRKEGELETFIGLAEQEIRDMEEGKSMVLLAKIYKTIQEIALKYGYSIVIDKEHTVYGEKVADITQKVLDKLGS